MITRSIAANIREQLNKYRIVPCSQAKRQKNLFPTHSLFIWFITVRL